MLSGIRYGELAEVVLNDLNLTNGCRVEITRLPDLGTIYYTELNSSGNEIFSNQLPFTIYPLNGNLFMSLKAPDLTYYYQNKDTIGSTPQTDYFIMQIFCDSTTDVIEYKINIQYDNPIPTEISMIAEFNKAYSLDSLSEYKGSYKIIKLPVNGTLFDYNISNTTEITTINYETSNITNIYYVGNDCTKSDEIVIRYDNESALVQLIQLNVSITKHIIPSINLWFDCAYNTNTIIDFSLAGLETSRWTGYKIQNISIQKGILGLGRFESNNLIEFDVLEDDDILTLGDVIKNSNENDIQDVVFQLPAKQESDTVTSGSFTLVAYSDCEEISYNITLLYKNNIIQRETQINIPYDTTEPLEVNNSNNNTNPPDNNTNPPDNTDNNTTNPPNNNNPEETPDDFVFTIDTSLTTDIDSSTQRYVLPLIDPNPLGYEGHIEKYNFVVYWGDGMSNAITDQNYDIDSNHYYSSDGVYKIIIRGKCEGISHIINSNFAHKIINISNWGTGFRLGDMGYYFTGCKNLTITAPDAPNLSETKILEECFKDCENLTNPLDTWDTSFVTNMKSMFEGCINFNQSLNTWNVGNVVNMNSMFKNASKFNSDISDWDVKNVSDMGSMFEGCSLFNQSLNTWNVGNVVNMNSMFKNASKFNSDISNWVTFIVSDMTSMFESASEFNKDIKTDGIKWNMNNVLQMGNMFKDAVSFNQDISSWNVEKVENMYGMFSGAVSFKQNISKWNPIMCVSFENMFLGVDINETGNTVNYDNLLDSWANKNLKIGTLSQQIQFHGGNSKYSFVATQPRMKLLQKNWNITDGDFNNVDEVSYTLAFEFDNNVTCNTYELTGTIVFSNNESSLILTLPLQEDENFDIVKYDNAFEIVSKTDRGISVYTGYSVLNDRNAIVVCDLQLSGCAQDESYTVSYNNTIGNKLITNNHVIVYETNVNVLLN